MSPEVIVLIAITLFAATVNGGLGYGFSSLTVPVALIYYTNRLLNSALVLIEVPLNAHVLWTNRAGIKNVWRRVLPILIGLLPGILLGTFLIHAVVPGWAKFITYVALAPLILLQAGGVRKPIRSEKAAGLALGSGVGVLYSLTTISGPPLALMFNNQGYAKGDFRAGLGLVRLVESSLTATLYLATGMLTLQSLKLVPYILPSILIGIPVGAWLIRRMPSEVFRRLCMSFDAWIIAYGLARVLAELKLADGLLAYLPMAVIGAIDAVLMVRFFAKRSAKEGEQTAPASKESPQPAASAA